MPPSELHRVRERTALRPELVCDGLSTGRLGTRLHYFEELPSTNGLARELAEEGAVEGEIVVAEAQTAGRGRLGRHWASPPFANLYMSAILRPKLSPARAPQITLMAAVALAETAEAFIPGLAEIKWPNDILVGGKKLAGILTELSCDAHQVRYAILGIGVNLNYPVEAMPEEIRAKATSVVALTGQNVSRESFLRRLIQDIDRCYGVLEVSGFAALAPLWESRFEMRGKRVRAEVAGRMIVGRARGIDPEGALLVEDESGALRRVIAGEVISLEN